MLESTLAEISTRTKRERDEMAVMSFQEVEVEDVRGVRTLACLSVIHEYGPVAVVVVDQGRVGLDVATSILLVNRLCDERRRSIGLVRPCKRGYDLV